jgi:hypothetical protein
VASQSLDTMGPLDGSLQGSVWLTQTNNYSEHPFSLPHLKVLSFECRSSALRKFQNTQHSTPSICTGCRWGMMIRDGGIR